MPAGRPTILDEAMLDKARAYIKDVGDYSNPLLPSIEGLAYRLDVARDTMYAWEKDNKEFSYILEKLRQVQATKLIDKGLNSQYNSTIAKLILSKHGYVEKQETESKEEITHKFENMTDEQLDAAIKAREAKLS